MIAFFAYAFLVVITAVVASGKGHSAFLWGVLSLFLPLLALIIILIIPSKQPQENLKKCPHCAEMVLKDAKICKHCKSVFEEV